MASLPVRSALARFGEACGLASWRGATVAIRELTVQGLVRMQLPDDVTALRHAIGAAVGVPLAEPGRLSGSGTRRCAWIAPAEWMWIVAAGEEHRVVEALSAWVPAGVLLTVVSDSRVCLRIEGDASADIMARGSGADFHEASFPPGHCTITRFAQLAVMVCRPDEAPAYELFVDRAHAAWLWQWLVDAAGEYGNA